MSGSTRDLYASIGSMYLGNAITMSLWGIATLQMYYYYNRYLKDALWIKLLVFLIWTLDTVHQALILKVGYTYVVTDYGNPQLLANSNFATSYAALFSVLVEEIVHLFLLFRIWILSKKNIKLVSILALLITLETICSIFELAKTFSVKQLADLKPYILFLKFCFSLFAATDTLIALTLIVLLHRSRTGFEKSNNIINQLIIFTVNTGAIPSLLSLLIIVMMEVYPNNMIWLSLYFFISKVYTNTLFATLNAREHSTETLRSTVSNSIPGIRKATNNDMLMAIQVDTTISHKTDDIMLDGIKTEVPGPKVASVDLV